MSAKLRTPIYSPADRLGDRPVRPQGDSHGRSHCHGGDGRMICAQRSACALHLRQLKEPIPNAMRLPRVEGRECHYHKEIAR